MARVKVKLDTSKLKDEFIFSTSDIESQDDLYGEVSRGEIVDYIMMNMIKIVSEEIVSDN